MCFGGKLCPAKECVKSKLLNTHINYSILGTRNGFSSSELWRLFPSPLDLDSKGEFKIVKSLRFESIWARSLYLRRAAYRRRNVLPG